MDKNFYVISFSSTHYAIMTEKLLKEKYPITVIPTLREITKSCGLSIKVAPEDFTEVSHTLQQENLDPKLYKIYQVQAINGSRTVHPIITENLS